MEIENRDGTEKRKRREKVQIDMFILAIILNQKLIFSLYALNNVSVYTLSNKKMKNKGGDKK